MTRKDFKLIATILRRIRTDTTLPERFLDCLAEMFAESLSAEYPNFRVDRFISACADPKENRI